MKRGIFLLTLAVLFSCSHRANAQVAPSATGAKSSLYIGGELVGGNTDYAGQVLDKKVTASPANKYTYGLGAFMDLRLNRWVQLEGSLRRSRVIDYGHLHTNTAQLGFLVPIFNDSKARFIPYGKALGGAASSHHDISAMYSLGAGCDYQYNKRIRIRVIDFEYQGWSMHPALHPYQYSMGVSIRLF